MAKVFKAPNRNLDNPPPIKLFLAGSIEMGVAVNWQTEVAKELSEYNVEIYDPRREEWDSSWKQDPTKGTQFEEQVSWELEHIENADIVLFYFDPNTKSPITLMELGVCLGLGKPVFIMCPQEYFRYGNVVVTAKHFDNDVHINEEDWYADIKTHLEMEDSVIEMQKDIAESVETVVEEEVKEAKEATEMYAYYEIISEARKPEVNDYIREKYEK